MPFIIHGATGAQGGPLFHLLLAKGKTALAAVRDPAKSEGKPSIVVDNSSIDSLVSAYTGADGSSSIYRRLRSLCAWSMRATSCKRSNKQIQGEW